MIIRNFYEIKLSQASYMIGCSATGEAIVIDPNREVRQYIEMASSLGLRIVAVTETHIHADFVSGTRELSAATGATMYLSAEGGRDWQYAYANDPLVVSLFDGDVIRIGNVSFRAMHTPGHTPEHIAFLLTDHPMGEVPHSLFAGDFVFVGDVGRPDLLERAAGLEGTMEDGARNMYRSLKKLQELPDSLLIWPGHGAGSACGKSLGGSPVTTLGYERATNWALLTTSEGRFVDEILAGQPDPPLYFSEMKRVNKAGPAVLGEMTRPKRKSRPVGQLIDIRDFDEIRSCCFDAAIAVPYCKSFTGWAGWMIRFDAPVTLIAESQYLANMAARDLSAIGLDQVMGWVHPHDLERTAWSPIPLANATSLDNDALVLDVRSNNERSAAHVKGSIHVHFGHLQFRLNELPRDRKIVVHCASGGRSPIAYSILRKAGFKNVVELPGGFSAIESEAPQMIFSPAQLTREVTLAP